MGRDRQRPPYLVFLLVSTHAPAWGATKAQIVHACDFFVSTHAPAWGATVCFRKFNSFQQCFNPRARMGRDVLAIDDC